VSSVSPGRDQTEGDAQTFAVSSPVIIVRPVWTVKPGRYDAVHSALPMSKFGTRIPSSAFGLVVLAVCGAAALIFYARTADAAFAPVGDIALIETYTIHATHGEMLLGPYSRYGWNHPGPLYFYLQAPFYVMSGYRSAGLSAGALAINLFALGILVWVCLRAAGPVFLPIGIAAAAALFSARAPDMLASQWNPHVLVLPTMAIVVVAAAIAAGRIHLLPVLVALASFVVQTHLGLGPAVIAVSGAATAMLIVRATVIRSEGATRVWPILTAALGVFLILWMLPLAQEFSRPEGNLTQLWMFFGAGEARPGQPWRISFRTWADMISALPRSDVHVGWGNRYRPDAGPWNQAWAIAETTAVAAIVLWAALRNERFRAALAAMTLIASLVGLWSITRIDDEPYDHLVFWLAGIGALQVGLIGDAVVRLIPRANRPVPVRLAAAACVLLFGVAVAEGFQGLRVIVSRSFRPGLQQLTARRLADWIAPTLEAKVDRPLVTIDQPAWGIAAGVLLQLRKRQIAYSVEEGWSFMFGPDARPTGDRDVRDKLIFAGPELSVRLEGRPGVEKLGERDRVSILLERPSMPLGPGTQP
jgi:hypothetical protein